MVTDQAKASGYHQAHRKDRYTRHRGTTIGFTHIEREIKRAHAQEHTGRGNMGEKKQRRKKTELGVSEASLIGSSVVELLVMSPGLVRTPWPVASPLCWKENNV